MFLQQQSQLENVLIPLFKNKQFYCLTLSFLRNWKKQLSFFLEFLFEFRSAAILTLHLIIFGLHSAHTAVIFSPLSLLFSQIKFQVAFLIFFLVCLENLMFLCVCVCMCGWLGLSIVQFCLSSYFMQQLSSSRCREYIPSGFSSMQ